MERDERTPTQAGASDSPRDVEAGASPAPRGADDASAQDANGGQDSWTRIKDSADNIYELIRPTDPELRDRPQLLKFAGREGTIATSFVEGARGHCPPQLPATLRRSLRLPSLPLPYGSVAELTGKLQAFFRGRARLTREETAILAPWALATWFPDCVQCAPKLILTGSAYRADEILRLLECTCRHPVLLAGLGSALQGISPDELVPTLLVSESVPGKALLRMLNAPPSRGYLVSVGKNLHRAEIWTACYVGQGLSFCRAPASLHLHLEPVKESAPTDSTDLTPDILQNELLSYRLLNLKKVAEISFEGGMFSPEFDAVARVLGACVLENAELKEQILRTLRFFDAKTRNGSKSDVPAILREVLLTLCHQHAGTKVFVAQVAAIVNEKLKEKGEAFTVSAEQTGHSLRKIGVATRRLGATGNGLLLDDEMQKLIHDLALGQSSSDSSRVVSCDFCSPHLDPPSTPLGEPGGV